MSEKIILYPKTGNLELNLQTVSPPVVIYLIVQTANDVNKVNMPGQVPPCGFTNENCAAVVIGRSTSPIMVVLGAVLLALLFAIVSFVVHRK